MSLRSHLRRSRKRRKARRANREQATRRLHFETFEDRRMLSFTPGVTIELGSSSWRDLTTADFNNDGHLDLAAAEYFYGKVSVLLGNGQGGFGSATLYDVGIGALSVAVGDFNEDGNLDLTVASMGDFTPSGLPSVSVLLGNGDGTFGPVKSLPTPFGARFVAVGDFNADGNLDLGISSSDGGYYSAPSVHLGDGEGNFAAPVWSDWIDGIFESATVADLNGDGADDLVLADNSKGPGGGLLIYLGGHPSGYLQQSDVFFYSSEARDVTVGDLNDDGVADLVTSNTGSDHGIWVLLGDELGGFGTPQRYAPGNFYEIEVVLGDFTGDGHVDIVYGSVNILRGNGDGTFSAPEQIPPIGAIVWAAGDLNGDGWLDIVARNHNTVKVMLNDRLWGQVDTNPLPGDYNTSGTVDAADYVVWRDSLGSSVASFSGADGSGNGVVDQADHTIWREHFGQSPHALPTVSVSDATVIEGNTGATNATFTVTLSKATNADVTVSYETLVFYAPAASDSDYIPASGTLTIPAGQTSGTFAVAVLGDRVAETTEYFAVNLSAPTNATLADAHGIATILDDEPRISIADVTNLEGRMGRTTLFTFTVTLSAAYDQAVSVSYRTWNGSASTSDNDYVAKTGTLSFAAGETTKTVTIEVKGDNKEEDDEVFFLNLFDNSINSAFVDLYSYLNGIGTILNDD